jgi:4a-hydroxytetrahydrobiopterin dehydratase
MALPPNAIHELVGEAASAGELSACKIGGKCGPATPLLPIEAVHARMPALPHWKLQSDGVLISREFTARHWQASMDFLNAVSAIAEAEGHHPDLHLTGWRNVRVDLSTHAVGGLTLPDLVLAAKIDTIGVDYSPKWLKSQQAAQPTA